MDKLFFVDKIGTPDIFVDYGCADGTLLASLTQWFHSDRNQFVGYDVDKDMADKASEKDHVTAYDEWDKIEARLGDQTSVLILSSVVHEVYHYLDVDGIDRFWNRVWNLDFDYIVLRDMIPSQSIQREPSINDVRKVRAAYGGTKALSDFEAQSGGIDKSQENLVHFLLKYRYTEPNWEREVREEYFPFYIEEFMSSIPLEYSVLYSHHYTLPYLKQCIRDDFHIELEENTHAKFILERR
jgi:SAM-dependent methyltransferase